MDASIIWELSEKAPIAKHTHQKKTSLYPQKSIEVSMTTQSHLKEIMVYGLNLMESMMDGDKKILTNLYQTILQIFKDR